MPLGGHKGELGCVVDHVSQAAVNQSYYYFPLEANGCIGGTAFNNQGSVRNAKLTKLFVQVQDNYVHLEGIGYLDQASRMHWLFGTGDANTDMPVGSSATYGLSPIEMDVELKDIKNVVVRLYNTHATSAKTVSMMLCYIPRM